MAGSAAVLARRLSCRCGGRSRVCSAARTVEQGIARFLECRLPAKLVNESFKLENQKSGAASSALCCGDGHAPNTSYNACYMHFHDVLAGHRGMRARELVEPQRLRDGSACRRGRARDPLPRAAHRHAARRCRVGHRALQGHQVRKYLLGHGLRILTPLRRPSLSGDRNHLRG